MKGEHPIRMLCELLKISHSGYYRWCQQRPSARQRGGCGHRGEGRGGPPSQPGYHGAPRILVDLQESGTHTSKRRCARLMRDRACKAKEAPPQASHNGQPSREAHRRKLMACVRTDRPQ